MNIYRITIPFQNIYFYFDRQGAFDYLRSLNLTEANANTVLQKVDAAKFYVFAGYFTVEKMED